VSANPEPPNPGNASAQWRWPVVAVLVPLLGLIGFVIGLRSCKQTAVESINAVGNQASNLVTALGKFNQATITQTFQEYLPQLSSEPGGRLEVASLNMNEVFKKSDHLITAWGKLDLGTTMTEIKVPATYRYYVRLHDPWRLDVSTNICIVHAPRLHPSLPPAIDTANMEKKSERGWARLNAAEQMDQLERDITPTLSTYAGDVKHLALVREESRKTVAQFVRDWLLKEQQWRDDRFNAIKVVFADEPETNLSSLPAVIELKGK
jgi:hypothetical protein